MSAEAQALFRLHDGLPQQGPGSDAATREALDRLPALSARPRILDLGCGPGRQTLVLAGALQAKVVALDRHRPFLEQLAAAARERGLGDLIEFREADMRAPPVAPGSIDLLWAEGAIYLLGFGEGLRLWRPLLAPHGLAAVTECSWLTDERPAEAVAFWRDAYAGMMSISENAAIAHAAGFELLDHFVLPQSAWWTDYYGPLEQRMTVLASDADPDLTRVIEATRREIDMFRTHGDAYGYVFYLMRRDD